MGSILTKRDEPKLELIIEGSGDIINLTDINTIGKSTCLIEYMINCLRVRGTGFLIEYLFLIPIIQ